MNAFLVNTAPRWTMEPIKRREITTVLAFAIIAFNGIFFFNASVQISAKVRRTGLGAAQYTPSRHTFTFDPEPILSRHHEDVEGLKPDGTYLLYHDIFHLGPNDDCSPLLSQRNNIKLIHYHYDTCQAFDRQFGNRLATMYGMKMMADSMHVPFRFTCGMEDSKANGAAYLMALNDLEGVSHPPIQDGVELSPEEVCREICGGIFCSWFHEKLDLAADSMVYDWRFLTRPDSVKVDDHDDAIIHLRLGDGLYSTNGENEGKGIFPHSTYVNLLMEAQREMGEIRSIGIVTAPFKGSHVRGADAGYTSLSELIAIDLVQSMQKAFPRTTIRIHNDPNGSIMESLARIVHARKVAICGCSTFCPYPLMVTNGIGYMYNPVGSQNSWVRNAAERNKNFRLFDTPMLNGMIISNQKTGSKLSDGDVMKWLRNQDISVGNVDIVEEPMFRAAVVPAGV